MTSKKTICDKRVTYDGLDICKLIASGLIVLLHAVETQNVYMLGAVYILTRFAVPFFFLSSGFLFYKGIQRNDQNIYYKKYISKISIMFFVWGCVIYAPFVIRGYFLKYNGQSNLKIIFLILRRLFIIGAGSWWYLLALIISISIIYFCYKKNTEWFLIFAIVLGFITCFLYTNGRALGLNSKLYILFYKVFNTIFSGNYNFIMTGIPFCGIGWLISKYGIKIKLSTSCLLFLCATFIRFLEYTIPAFLDQQPVSFMYIFQSIFFFFLSISIKGRIAKAVILRNMSTVIYLVHWIILYEVFNPICFTFGLNPYKLHILPIKVLFTLIICIGIYYLVKRLNNKYINAAFGM